MKKNIKDNENQPVFGAAKNAPPSFYARIPSASIRDKRLSDKQFRALAALCSYANNQGFAWPNRGTVAKALPKAGGNTVTIAWKKSEQYGYLNKISKCRSNPKWRHVMGTVWRVVYDDRLTEEELIDAMTKEEPPAIQEQDLPKQKDTTSNQQIEKEEEELVDYSSLATHYASLAQQKTGCLRLVNPRAIEGAQRAGEKLGIEGCKRKIALYLDTCRKEHRPPAEHLGGLF